MGDNEKGSQDLSGGRCDPEGAGEGPRLEDSPQGEEGPETERRASRGSIDISPSFKRRLDMLSRQFSRQFSRQVSEVDVTFICTKIVLSCCDFLFMIGGWLILGLGLWLYIYKYTIVYNTILRDNPTQSWLVFDTVPLALIVLGSVISLIGFLGCCGSYTESVCFLGFYAAFVILYILGQIVGIILFYIFITTIESSIIESLQLQLRYEYNTTARYSNDTESLTYRTTVAWDQLQLKTQCCGALSPTDYYNSLWYNKTSQQQAYFVPLSCCVPLSVLPPISLYPSNHPRPLGVLDSPPPSLNPAGVLEGSDSLPPQSNNPGTDPPERKSNVSRSSEDDGYRDNDVNVDPVEYDRDINVQELKNNGDIDGDFDISDITVDDKGRNDNKLDKRRSDGRMDESIKRMEGNEISEDLSDLMVKESPWNPSQRENLWVNSAEEKELMERYLRSIKESDRISYEETLRHNAAEERQWQENSLISISKKTTLNEGIRKHATVLRNRRSETRAALDLREEDFDAIKCQLNVFADPSDGISSLYVRHRGCYTTAREYVISLRPIIASILAVTDVIQMICLINACLLIKKVREKHSENSWCESAEEFM